MRTQTLSVGSISLGCLLALALVRSPHRPPPAQVSLDLATIHAAVLSSARSPADSTDAPYLLVSIFGSGGGTETHALPAGGRWDMSLNEAITGLGIARFSLQPGDSVRVVLSVLEDRAAVSDELQVATSTTSALANQRSLVSPPGVRQVTEALAPLTSRGAYWLGSTSLLLTNDGGTTYWTSLDCVASCAVVRSPIQGGPGAVLKETEPRPATGVVELTGASGTYHVQVALRRVD